jgi:four helix bundle protein
MDESGRIESHRDLIVRQKAMELAVQAYRLAAKFPPTETYRLVSQVTRAAASVPANIAEGFSRATRKDYANFLPIAKGSLMETETFLMPAIRLSYISRADASVALAMITEISKMLTVLRSRLSANAGSRAN